MFKRRIGPDPHLKGKTPGIKSCPDIWELENGDFAIIGIENTQKLIKYLPANSSCGPDENIIVIPRRVLVDAKSDIPEE